MRIVLVFFLLSTASFSQTEKILVVGNYSPLCLPDSTYSTSDSLPETLEGINVLMLFSSSTSNLSTSDIDKIEEYIRNGGGLYSGSDNWPLQAQSNQITHQIYLKESFGNYKQKNAELNVGGNLDLLGIDTIPAGETTAAFPMDYRLKVEAWVEDQPLISSGTLGQGKIIIDGGYSRFYCNFRNASSDALLREFIVFLSSK